MTDKDLTCKEALAVLYRLNEAVGWHLYSEQASPLDKALREQVWTALRVLRHVVHGQAPLDCIDRLCEVCYLHYVPLNMPFVYLKSKPNIPYSLCPQCLERYEEEGNVVHLENWETGEVIPC